MSTEHRYLSDKIIVSIQYFIYFGITGIYLPYFNLYCYHLNFSGFQIGLLSSTRSLTLIVFPLFWGILADRYQSRRTIFILCNVLSTAIWALYLLTVNFWYMLCLTLFFGTFNAPIISFLEAFSMDILAKEKKNYGHLRVWGSISFILAVIIMGRIIDLFSIEIIIGILLIGFLMRTAVSVKLPDIRVEKKQPFIQGVKKFLNRRTVFFLISGFLMLVSHGTYYGFFSIHLENLGYGNTFIGVSWAVAIIVEILIMTGSNRIFKRFPLENVLVFSILVTAFRWFVVSMVRSPAIIVMTQALHGFSYGSFHIASILYIDRLAPDEAKTIGQAFNNAISYGLGLMVGFLINGYLYEMLGSFVLFGISGGIALAGGILLFISAFWAEKTHESQASIH